MRTLLLSLLGACVPLALHAQQRDTLLARDQLPRDVARETVALFNATTTLRATERTDIEAGREVAGDVAVLNGPLTVGGHVRGPRAGDQQRRDPAAWGTDRRRSARGRGRGRGKRGRRDRRRAAHLSPVAALHAGGRPARGATRGNERRGAVVASARASRPAELQPARDREAGVYNRVEGLPVRIGPVLYRDRVGATSSSTRRRCCARRAASRARRRTSVTR